MSCFDLESNMNWSIVWVIMKRRGVSSERRRSSSSSWFCYGLRQVRKTCSYNSDHVKYTGGGLWRYISYIFCGGLIRSVVPNGHWHNEKQKDTVACYPSRLLSWDPGACVIKRPDTDASLLTNGIAAFKEKLPCHWLKGLHQCHVAFSNTGSGWELYCVLLSTYYLKMY